MQTSPSARIEISKLNPSSIIELFEVKTSARLHGNCEIYRFHAGINNKSVVSDFIWAGNIYYAWPVEAEGFEYSGTGSLPRPKIKVANINSMITAALLEVNQFTFGSDLTGAEVKRVRTLARFVDNENFADNTNPYGTPDPDAKLPDEIYYIDRKAAESIDMVEFELVSIFDLAGVRAPKRQTINNVCQWRYRGVECGYDGDSYFDENDAPVLTESQDVCGKRLPSCEKRFGENNPLPFGGFPGVGPYF